MLNQVLSHTPAYVWLILALLLARGVMAMRQRETTLRKLFIIPCIMLPVALLDIARKFGIDGLPLASWALGVAATMWLVWWHDGPAVAAGVKPGSVRVAGSVMPLLLMLVIFAVKYVTTVMLVVAPALLHGAAMTTACCALLGAANGYFFGRLLRDVVDYQALETPRVACAAA